MWSVLEKVRPCREKTGVRKNRKTDGDWTPGEENRDVGFQTKNLCMQIKIVSCCKFKI